MSASNLFLGGVPTKPDVDKLREAFGVPAEGTLLPWKSIESACGLKRGTHRFTTVVVAWRKALDREHNVILGPCQGKGLVCLPPNERVQLSAGKVKSGVRMVGRGARISATSDRSRMSPESQATADHINRMSASIRLALATESKGSTLPSLEVKKG